MRGLRLCVVTVVLHAAGLSGCVADHSGKDDDSNVAPNTPDVELTDHGGQSQADAAGLGTDAIAPAADSGPESGGATTIRCEHGAQAPCRVGDCAGTQHCVGGAWTECSGSEERCNGRDDDCDGETDEELTGAGDPCVAGTGQCQRNGTLVCDANQQAVVCNVEPTDPSAETCDGLDNDCDGQTDEDLPGVGDPCAAGTDPCRRAGVMVCDPQQRAVICDADPTGPSAETCDGIDNDCDGQTDENLAGAGDPCAAGTGQCRREGIRVCDPQQRAVVCNAEPADPSAETCDGLDNDCDGDADEELAGAGDPCRVGLGLCQREGTLVCDAEQHAVLCDAEPGDPLAETCDGLDNDCDGVTDEELAGLGDACTVGSGPCEREGIMICNAEQQSVVCDAEPPDPAAENCDDAVVLTIDVPAGNAVPADELIIGLNDNQPLVGGDGTYALGFANRLTYEEHSVQFGPFSAWNSEAQYRLEWTNSNGFQRSTIVSVGIDKRNRAHRFYERDFGFYLTYYGMRNGEQTIFSIESRPIEEHVEVCADGAVVSDGGFDMCIGTTVTHNTSQMQLTLVDVTDDEIQFDVRKFGEDGALVLADTIVVDDETTVSFSLSDVPDVVFYLTYQEPIPSYNLRFHDPELEIESAIIIIDSFQTE